MLVSLQYEQATVTNEYFGLLIAVADAGDSR
jgi:hypothetical protein